MSVLKCYRRMVVNCIFPSPTVWLSGPAAGGQRPLLPDSRRLDVARMQPLNMICNVMQKCNFIIIFVVAPAF